MNTIVEINFLHLLAVTAALTILYGAVGFYCGKKIGKLNTVTQMTKAGYKQLDTKMIWDLILRNMSNDNNVEIARTQDDYERVELGLEKLITAGYFADNPYKLTDSFWMIASGSESERIAYFQRESEGFEIVDTVLTDLLERAS